MEILSKQVVYKCPVLNIEERKVLLNDGVPETRWVVVRPPNISVIGLTNDKEIILIRETVGKKPIEVVGIPGGKMRGFDHTPEELMKEALIELETEAGYHANHVELYDSHEVASDYFERTYYRCVAWDLENIGQHLESGELIKVFTVPFQSVSQFIDNELLNGRTRDVDMLAVKSALIFFKERGLI